MCLFSFPCTTPSSTSRSSVFGGLGSQGSCRHTDGQALTVPSVPQCGIGGVVTFPDPISEWRKSSASGPENCVEVLLGRPVMVRDSKVSEGPRLAVGSTAWASFLDSLSRHYAAS
ncbi:DUF397 domain-containing protein [Streptomyces sp. NPDC059696]|uniref:DUF397 domain-containing protein n=1 Tax=Streptomyces sp. NPDC059696 TaxID=3346911 RepID=UPI0036B585D6